jgi:hypothetical protein
MAAPHVEGLDVLLVPGADACIPYADDVTDPTSVLTALMAGAATCSGLQRLRLKLPRSWLHERSCRCLLALPAGLQHMSISAARLRVWELAPSWSAAFTSLRRLPLQAADRELYIDLVQWAPSGLQELALDGRPVRFSTGVAGLPASLTNVCLACVGEEGLPDQFSAAATVLSSFQARALQLDPSAAQ